MLAVLEYKAKDAAKRSAYGAIGLVFLVAGMGFLTVAAYIVLAAATSAATAALVIGFAYVGLALIAFALAFHRRRYAPPVHTHPAEEAPFSAVGTAFVQGMGAGYAAREGFDRARS